jgi:uncharacterized membrane protein
VGTRRNSALDALRGLVIVLMALDHARGFIAPQGMGPENLQTTSLLFFLCRWLTHLCAPSFVLLMGVGVGLRRMHKPLQMESYLLSRGLWIVLLEILWVTFCFYWSIDRTYLGVLWALGGSMVLLAPLVRLPGRWLLLMGIALTILLDVLRLKGGDVPVVGFLFAPHGFEIASHRVHAAYALIPWLGVAMIGVGIGPWLARARSAVLGALGAGMLGLFALLRALQLGDPSSWSVHDRGTMFTAMDFLNPSKYPPSLDFLLLTLGAAMLLLSGPMRGEGRLSRWLSMFGRVPLFFYLLHLPLAHLLGNSWAWAMHGTARVPGDTPLSIPLILGAWIAVVVILWPACRAWRGLKQRRPDLKWLAYL